MKTITRIIALLLVLAMLVNLTGCYGSFALTKKVYEWNGSLGDKWINSIVMWVLMFVPVYSFAGFIDLVILNTVEFWTGSNPLAMRDGEQAVKFVTNDGKTYKIVMSKNNMNILETEGPDKGKSINLSYSPETGNWIMSDGNVSKVVASMNKNNLKLIYPNGDYKTIEIAR